MTATIMPHVRLYRQKKHCISHFFCKNVANKFLKEREKLYICRPLKNEKSYIFADQKFR